MSPHRLLLALLLLASACHSPARLTAPQGALPTLTTPEGPVDFRPRRSTYG